MGNTQTGVTFLVLFILILVVLAFLFGDEIARLALTIAP